MSIAENIKQLRLQHNMSQEEIAQIAKVTVSAVSTWELGKREPRMGAIQRIADYFGLKKSDIIEDNPDKTTILPTNARLVQLNESNYAPVIGSVKCGPGGLAYEYIDEYIPIDNRYPADEVVAFIAEGDSMEGDGIQDGDICLVHKQEEVPDNAIAVVVVVDGAEGEGTMKHVHKGDGVIVLNSSNPAYPPRVFAGEEANRIHIVGKVIEIRHRT